MSKHVIEFKSTRRVDRIELKVELNSIELNWLFSTQLNTVTQSELSWATQTRRQIYLYLSRCQLSEFEWVMKSVSCD